jgi:methylase of polypeptide subunit release factors
MVRAGAPLVELLSQLKAAQYHFITVTPATHARVLERAHHGPITLSDIFGWNRPFAPADLRPDLMALLRDADALEPLKDKFRSTVRVATLGEDLLLHGAFPTDGSDAVFFGPDTYRFARFIEQRLPRLGHAGWLVDMGAGSGAGAIAASRAVHFERVTMVDVNAAALQLAAVNAAAAQVRAESVQSETIPAGANLVIANPPYRIDASHRTYRDGGELVGGAVSLAWAQQALAALAPGGAMLLYTGAAYIDGRAPLLEALQNMCSEAGTSLALEEIDPDVFGDELEKPDYADVERIAAMGAVITVSS